MHRYSAKIIVRSDAIKKNGKAALCLQCFINGKRKVLPVHIEVEPAFFDRAGEKVIIKGNKKRTDEINSILYKIRSRALDLFHYAVLYDQPLTSTSFAEKMQNTNSTFSFYDWMEKEIEEAYKNNSPDTCRIYKNSLDQLKAYKSDVYFVDLDYDFIEGWDRHLHSRNYKPNTIWRFHKDLKKFINLAIKKKFPIQNPYVHFKVTKAKTEPLFLTYQEFRSLCDLYKSKDLNIELQRILRYFLFMCVSSLRVSDLRLLTDDNIVSDTLVFQPVKTRNSRMILKNKLSSFAFQLIEDAKGEHPKRLFNVITDQKINEYLKQIARFADIKKAITTKVGRHTFATLFLEAGGKVEVLQQIMGHSKIETTMGYVHLTKKQQRRQMDNFDDYILS